MEGDASGETRPKTALVALGGNALLERGEEPTAANQTRHAREAAAAMARLVQEEGVVLLVTHGNGPQVGLLALQVPALPFAACTVSPSLFRFLWHVLLFTACTVLPSLFSFRWRVVLSAACTALSCFLQPVLLCPASFAFCGLHCLLQPITVLSSFFCILQHVLDSTTGAVGSIVLNGLNSSTSPPSPFKFLRCTK